MSCEIINTPPLNLFIQRANASIDVISNGFVGSSTVVTRKYEVRWLYTYRKVDTLLLTYAESNVVFRGKSKKKQYELSVPPIVDSSLVFVGYRNIRTWPIMDGFAQLTCLA